MRLGMMVAVLAAGCGGAAGNGSGGDLSGVIWADHSVPKPAPIEHGDPAPVAGCDPAYGAWTVALLYAEAKCAGPAELHFVANPDALPALSLRDGVAGDQLGSSGWGYCGGAVHWSGSSGTLELEVATEGRGGSTAVTGRGTFTTPRGCTVVVSASGTATRFGE